MNWFATFITFYHPAFVHCGSSPPLLLGNSRAAHASSVAFVTTAEVQNVTGPKGPLPTANAFPGAILEGAYGCDNGYTAHCMAMLFGKMMTTHIRIYIYIYLFRVCAYTHITITYLLDLDIAGVPHFQTYPCKGMNQKVGGGVTCTN